MFTLLLLTIFTLSIISAEGSASSFYFLSQKWCGHCTKLTPTWNDLVDKYKNDGRITFEKVDCEENKSTCHDFGVKGYPTLIFVKKDGSHVRYHGSRSLSDLSQFVEDNSH